MKKMRTVLLVFLLTAVYTVNLNAQWKYTKKITFPGTDTSFVQPFLCTVDDNGRLYVVSSRSTNLNAHDAIYFLKNPNDTVLTKMIDYTAIGDTVNIKMLVGITHIKNNILVSGKINNFTSPGGQSCGYYYIDGDTSKGTRYGYSPYLSGWGTFVLGVAATKDSIVFAGTDYTKGIRTFNFSTQSKLSGFAAYMAPDNQNAEPGGPSTAGFDVIRDCAVVPNGNYFDPKTPFYTSRNSKDAGELNGGIAVWTGGTQYNQSTLTTNHQNYSALRVLDLDNYLSFNSSIPYGITCDNNGTLWVAGIDSTRRWVKGFKVEVGLVSANASQVDELPSAGKKIKPDPKGAPMTGPSDVAFTPDNKTGYVIDAWQRCVYRFNYGTTDVKAGNNVPSDFNLYQNYPNPFNPSTAISYSLPQGMYVKLVVTNSLGQEVAMLANGYVSAGKHTVEFDAKNLSNGVYFYTLTTEKFAKTNKMVLLK
ncbi:MAG: T9SS type A sorting domain-containing protein [Ignavibacteriales bacterium]